MNTNNNNIDISLLKGDELNNALENILFIEDEEKKKENIIKENAYKAYLKHQEYLKTYRTKHKQEILLKAKERYYNDDEYRKNMIEKQRERYFLKRYGMTKEEHIKQKEEQNKELFNTYKKSIENKKNRLLTFEQFTNKYIQ